MSFIDNPRTMRGITKWRGGLIVGIPKMMRVAGMSKIKQCWEIASPDYYR